MFKHCNFLGRCFSASTGQSTVESIVEKKETDLLAMLCDNIDLVR